MPYTPVEIPRFGGLDLRRDPQEVGAQGCVDMLNVDLDKDGRARTRDGSTAFTAAVSGTTSTTAADILPMSLAGTPSLAVVVTNVSTPRVYLSKSTSTGTLTAVGDWQSVFSSMTRFGSPTSELLFIAGVGSTLRKYDGTTLSTSVGKPRHVEVSAQSNRLIQGNFALAADSPTGADGSIYTAHWSDAGTPETYTSANNQYVHFNPGDGYGLEAIKTWGASTFIFKGNCFYVVYGESVDGSGLPIFNYRRVEIEGLLYTSDSAGYGAAVAVASDGLYYATTRGVYRTTGGPGVLVSQAISPVFTDLAHGYHIDAFRSLSVAKGRLYFNLEFDGAADRTLVFDPQTGEWMLWSLLYNASRFVDWRTGPAHQGEEERIYFLAGGKVHYLDPAATSDAGTAIASSYTSGIYDMGTPGHDAYTRYTRLWGYGTPTLSVFTDHGSADSNAAAVTLGTAPAIAEGYHSKSYKGRLFQHKLSAASGAWGVNRLIHDVAWVR